MDATKLFEIGNFPSKIVGITKFSMKQVCKPTKKAILMLTSGLIISLVFCVSGHVVGAKKSASPSCIDREGLGNAIQTRQLSPRQKDA